MLTYITFLLYVFSAFLRQNQAAFPVLTALILQK